MFELMQWLTQSRFDREVEKELPAREDFCCDPHNNLLCCLEARMKVGQPGVYVLCDGTGCSVVTSLLLRTAAAYLRKDGLKVLFETGSVQLSYNSLVKRLGGKGTANLAEVVKANYKGRLVVMIDQADQIPADKLENLLYYLAVESCNDRSYVAVVNFANPETAKKALTGEKMHCIGDFAEEQLKFCY